MTVMPRYRPGAVRIPFVNREGVLAALDDELAAIGSRPRVIVLTGVGGIGKSRLLHELKLRATRAKIPVATLNLQEPAQRSQLAGLASIRVQFGEAKIRFDRFDIAYAVWWQRLNPHVPLSTQRLSFAADSEILTSILDEVSGLPIFGSAFRAIEVAMGTFKRWRAVRDEPALQEFDELTLDRQADAVTYLFAQELNAHGPFVLCVDAYEALVGGVSRGGQTMAADAWLRDLIGQLEGGMVAVASREPLGWQAYDQDWGNRIREIRVGPLPYAARLELLDALGEADQQAARKLADQSGGLPYYLNLAREAGALSGGDTRGRLEERFMRNVDPELVPMFELLSVARVFDREIFSRLTGHYGLRQDTRAWETLIAHSFVAEAGAGTLQLHQVMARAVRDRLSAAMLNELHSLLHDAWRARAAVRETPDAWREAAHHAAHVRGPRTPVLLSYADRLAALAGRPGLEVLLSDLQDAPRAHELGELRRLLAAEAAFVVGDAHQALAITADVAEGIGPDADEITARLQMAAAHALRIIGDTAAALRRYTGVWRHYQGSVGLEAGMWVADLHMAQGRFADAVQTTADVLDRCPPDRPDLRGNLHRLLFLAHRFSFDAEGAVRHLEAARAAYTEAKHLVGGANVVTNEAELLVLTDPPAGVREARRAIELQQQLGAEHELGKSYTAEALGLLGMGDLDACGEALDRAVEVLERCGYRSGRARAELARALWHARSGRRDLARDSAIWAVTELEEAAVYPTLMIVAGVLLDRIGKPAPRVSRVVEAAIAQIQPLHGMERLIDAITAFVIKTIDDRWDEVFARSYDVTQAANGFYHRNVRVGPYLVREPIPGAEPMDLHIWREPDVLSAIGEHITAVPRLHAVSGKPVYQIHEWIDGMVLDAVAPRGTRVPEGFLDAVVKLFADLEHVPLAELPAPPPDWPPDGDSASFARLLLAITRNVHSRFAGEFAAAWQRLGIPADPFAELRLHEIRRRGFRVVHADVHRKNVIIQPSAVSRQPSHVYVFLDWELALPGDPVYELAVHLHKMGYQPDEEDALIRLWERLCERGRWDGWEQDLSAYRAHERVKSAVVDSVRYIQLVAQHPDRLDSCAASLEGKLVAASRVWETVPVGRDVIVDVLTTGGRGGSLSGL